MLMRFDPFRDLSHGVPSSILAMDAYRRGHDFLVKFDIPGADPSTIDVSVEKNVLTVRAERTAAKGDVDEVIVTERRFGSFTRQLFLGESLVTDGIQAAYDDGVLTITIPVAEKAQPRQIRVAQGRSDAAPVETNPADTTVAA